MKTDYWVCVITKNGADFIGQTLASIFDQTSPPAFVVVVDDGSTDATPTILEDFSSRLRKGTSPRVPLDVINLPDNGYDIRRVPANLNAAYAYVEEIGKTFEYSMVSGDDCAYPSDYCAVLLSEMDDDHLVVASGDCETPPRLSDSKAPQGSGRFVRNSFWQTLGGRYPVRYGWESWLLFKAMQAGHRILNLSELRYHHLRPSGSVHKFTHWGLEMRALGYHPLVVLKRFVDEALGRGAGSISLQGSLSMTMAYFLARLHDEDPYYVPFDEQLRSFVRNLQLDRLLNQLPSEFRPIASAFWTITGRLANP